MQRTFSRLSRQSTGANTTSLTTKIFPTPAPKLLTLGHQIKSHHFSSSALKSRIIPSPITSSFSQCFRTKETQAVKASKKSVPKRFFATSGGKVIDAAPPPPPPPNSGGGNGMWLLLTAALVGGGVYYRNEISDYFGRSGKKSEGDGASKGDSGAKPVTQAVEKLNTQDLKKDVVDAEERLKKAEKQAEVKVEVQKAAASAEKKVENASASKTQEVDWKAVREEIVKLLDDPNYDDGSYGPVFVRLAWHNAGTYDKKTGKGGSEGACMRFEAEGGWGANAGLDVARARLEPIKKKFPGITYSDLWSYAGTVAIEEMGGPEMKWRPGRKDYVAEENVLPLGLLPDADGREHKETPQDHVRFIFNRMGFNDQEMVALIGGHALGRCHTNRSGFWGPWTYAPTTMSNEFFRLLLEETWSKKKTHQGKEWTGPEQYENKTGELMMLPTDMCLVWDPKFKKYVELYAKDQAKFDQDFSKAWMKLQELGVKKFHGWRRYIFFGPRE